MADYRDCFDSTYEIQQETLARIMNPHGDEVTRRLEQIVERQKLNLPAVDRLKPEFAEAVRDIDFLLSLLTSPCL